jgi:hypothetical protein
MIELYDLRGCVEHQELEISEFEVIPMKNENPKINLPKIEKSNILVHDYINVTFLNTFGYCEDMIALLLSLKCRNNFEIIALPEKERDRHRNFKYIIFLNQKLCESLNKKIMEPK